MSVGDILPMAVGVAISPVPIIAVILMLFSSRARRNGPAFLAGWMGGLLVVGGIVLVLAKAGKLSEGGAPTAAAYAVKLLLGALFLFLAFRQWQSRPKAGEEPSMPAWMAGIDAFTPPKALATGALLSGVNPKNLALTVSAAMSIVGAGLSGAQAWLALLVFVLLASVTVGVPVLYYLAAGQRAEQTLAGWKAWLSANHATVMFVLLLIFGVVLVAQGIDGLAA